MTIDFDTMLRRLRFRLVTATSEYFSNWALPQEQARPLGWHATPYNYQHSAANEH